MKAALLVILIGFTSAIAFAQGTEDENIKKVISEESTAAYKGDMEPGNVAGFTALKQTGLSQAMAIILQFQVGIVCRLS